MIKSLSTVTDIKDLSLYIHIPFCLKKCHYCDFYSRSCSKDDQSIISYSEKLISEIEEVSRRYGKPFETIYIGGGNPGILAEEQLSDLISALTSTGKPKEFSIEMNPESVTDGKLSILSGTIDRLSIGVQSLQEKNLSSLGRNTSRDLTLEGLQKILPYRDAFALNIDMIDVVPGQQFDDTIRDIDLIHDFIDPDHFSIYDLIIEEGTPLHARLSIDPLYSFDHNGNLEMDTADIHGHLRELGYERYEVSSYAKPGKSCLHNLRYWSMRPYLGIGPSAASTIPSEGRIIRINGITDTERYIWASDPFSDDIYTEENIGPKEFLEELVIMGLRTSDGIDMDEIRELFRQDLTELIPETIGTYQKQGDLMISQDRYLSASSSGMVKLNTILIDMFIELDKTDVYYFL